MSELTVFEVENRDQFAAAVKAAARSTKAEALNNPFKIVLLGTTFVFTCKQGLEEHRAKAVHRKIRRAHRDTFTSRETL